MAAGAVKTRKSEWEPRERATERSPSHTRGTDLRERGFVRSGCTACVWIATTARARRMLAPSLLVKRPSPVCGLFITNRSARASKDHQSERERERRARTTSSTRLRKRGGERDQTTHTGGIGTAAEDQNQSALSCAGMEQLLSDAACEQEQELQRIFVFVGNEDTGAGKRLKKRVEKGRSKRLMT